MKRFFGSIYEDFKNDFLGHWRRFIGFLIAYLGPLLFIGACYVSVSHESHPANDSWAWSVPFAVWPVLIALAIFYWAKIKKSMAGELAKMETQNDVEEGKHYALIVIFTSVKWAMTALSFLLVWWVLTALEDLLVSVAFTFLVVAMIECAAGLFYVWDALATRK
jgi:hypothetical protein